MALPAKRGEHNHGKTISGSIQANASQMRKVYCKTKKITQDFT